MVGWGLQSGGGACFTLQAGSGEEARQGEQRLMLWKLEFGCCVSEEGPLSCHSVLASGCGGFSCRGAWGLGLGASVASVVVVQGL